jgi:glucosamine-6-phosphate deaminase
MNTLVNYFLAFNGGNGVQIKVFLNYENLCEMAANEVVSLVNTRPSAVLGLPTGGTPTYLYKNLISCYKNGRVSFSQTVTFNLDEYVGIPPDHPQSYHSYMRKHFFNHIDIREENIHIPYAENQEINQFCQSYENKIIKSGGIDLLILGLGKNGHIGFNEPGSQLTDQTKVVALAESTIKSNSRYFNSIVEVPRKAVTMGISTILRSSKIILLASGKEKAIAISKLLSSEPSSEFPASFLKLHQDVTLFVDKEAYSS